MVSGNVRTVRIPDLSGKSVLVTGASRGIGRAVALAFAAQGCQVAIHYGSSLADAETVLAEANKVAPGHVIVGGDLSEAGTAARVVTEVAESLGGLDILVNNAGRMGTRTPVDEIDARSYAEVMDLNARSVTEMCAAAVPHLRKTRGLIINTSSVNARRGSGGTGTLMYSASKGYIIILTKSLALELGTSGIRVNAVAPGLVKTEFHDLNDREIEAMASQIPLGRIAAVQDCVGAYLFLASSAMSGYITGQSIEVNGGFLMP